jgi:hypothetical protein
LARDATNSILIHFDALPDSAIVKAPVVQALFGGISDEGLRRGVKAGRIPAPIKLGQRLNGWTVGGLRKALARLQGAA